MKKTGQPTRNQDSGQAYTHDDSSHFEHLMQLARRVTGLSQVHKAPPMTQRDDFEYSNDDARLFEIISSALTGFRRHGQPADGGKSPRGGNYTQNDQKLFEFLTSYPVSADHPNPPRSPDAEEPVRTQEYSASDLDKFHAILPGLPEEKNGGDERDILGRSPGDRDVGKIKIKKFDAPASGTVPGLPTRPESENSAIKVKYFD